VFPGRLEDGQCREVFDRGGGRVDLRSVEGHRGFPVTEYRLSSDCPIPRY
jgi:hypothetical protein